MSELEPTPELPDNTSIREVKFPDRIKAALFTAGIKTVGEVRAMSDAELVALPDIGGISLAFLRETLGLPSTAGVRPPKNLDNLANAAPYRALRKVPVSIEA